MDAEWELIERTKSINAMVPPTLQQQQASASALAATLAELQAAKQEGNACFQQRQLADAVQRYSFVVDCCIAKLADNSDASSSMRDASERSAVVEIEVAVRLNRALANIERREFAAAEDDCAAVLRQQPACVKALYRRALAREQLGKLEHARADIQAMLQIEPSNPAALELRTRLDASNDPSAVSNDASALADEMRSCSVTARTAETSEQTASRIELAAAAEQAWRALQDEELQMRRAVSTKQQVHASTKPAAVTPTRHRNATKNQDDDANSNNKSKHSAFMAHTNDLWASLAQEEQRTVQRVSATRRTRAAK